MTTSIRTRFLLAPLAAAGLIAAGVPASADAATGAWHNIRSLTHTRTAVENGTGTHTATLRQMILPDRFNVRARNSRRVIGPIGSCRSTGWIDVTLVRSAAADATAFVAAELPVRTSGQALYGTGTRGSASFRVVKQQGGSIWGTWAKPTRIAPDVYVVVRARTRPNRTCHIGGVRESLGYPLADGMATIDAAGF